MKKIIGLFALCCCFVLPAFCGEKEKKDDIEYGPFISATIVSQWPKNTSTHKGIAVRLGQKNVEAGIVFDTDLLRVSAGWTGGFLNLQGIPFNMEHGVNPELKGVQRFGTRPGPGWAKAGVFNDPRPVPFGPLPADWAKYKGLYRNGSKIIFSYTVGKCSVLESHSFEGNVFFREFTLGPAPDPLELLVCETESSSAAQRYPAAQAVAIEETDGVTGAKLFDGPAGAEFNFPKGTAISLKLPASEKAVSFKIAIWMGAQKDFDAFAQFTTLPSSDLHSFCQGGLPQWPQTAVGEGKLGKPDGTFPYVVDTLPIIESPMLRTTGFDFFKDGRMAVCTLHGDVWIISGVDADLKKVTWKRFASGLFQPLGLKIVDDVVYVLGRDQITRLEEIGAKGEADFYANFNNDTLVSDNFHEFAMDLQTDAEGNFYFTKAGPVVPGGNGFETVLEHHGCLLRVSKDGSKLDVVATGLRAANGISIGPNGEMTSADNEGTWVPTSRINMIKPGGFYGCPPLAHQATAPTTMEPPLCWIPHATADNSSGGQVWVTGTNGRWGPLDGRLLHMSYGKASLFLVMAENVDNVWQGGVVKFPLKFLTGIMRGRFNPRDGQLYVCGVRGWQTDGLKWGMVQRVRYTGGPVHLPSQIQAKADGVYITFFDELDKNAADEDNFQIEEWNYRWTGKYGSDLYMPSNPNKAGVDEIKIASAKLMADKKTIHLEIANLKPVMQMHIKYKIKTADGTKLNQEIFNTINVIK